MHVSAEPVARQTFSTSFAYYLLEQISKRQVDATWYKPVSHDSAFSNIPRDALGTIQDFHPKLLSLPGNHVGSSRIVPPVAGRFDQGGKTDPSSR